MMSQWIFFHSFIVVNASAIVVVSTARKKKVLGIVVAEPIINIV